MKSDTQCDSVADAPFTEKSPLELSRQVARILREDAGELDQRGTFPVRGIQALKETGLMALLVPKRIGGMGASYTIMSEVAQVLSSECLSTALIWVMHCQQVAVLVEHAPEPLREGALRRVVEEGALIASVTSERTKGGHLLTALAPLVISDGEIELSRQAPTVTGGMHGDAYLVTMRADESSPPSDVVLVYAERDDLHITKLRDWIALGMRGTDSVSLSLSGRLSKDHLINEPSAFKRIAVATIIPVGHIGWAACWLGATLGILRRSVSILRQTSTQGALDLKSDLFAERLARIRLDIDSIDSYLTCTLQDYEKAIRDSDDAYQMVSSRLFQLRINGLKILASERSFHAVDELMNLVGMSRGYLLNSEIPLERVFRDLRSANLMFSNYRLLIANGKLALLESTSHLEP